MTPGGNSVRFGAAAWASSAQFFATQAVVQSAWNTPFSLASNYISDLGNTTCGPFPPGSQSYICSPWHAAMNASFLLTGVAIGAGAWLVRDRVRSVRWRLGLSLIAIGGLGLVLVGVFPENVNFPPHRLGAALHFVSGNLGMVVIGFSLLGIQRRWAAGSIASGVLGLLATSMFVMGRYLGMGVGGMERLAAYPLPLWTTLVAFFLWRRRAD